MSGVDALPGVLAEIADVAGRDAAIEIAVALGGRRLYLPRTGRPPPALTRIAGDRARLFAARYAGETIDIPLAHRAVARYLARRGFGTAAIAARLGIAQRTAQRYVRRER